jgi:hypothetical protein
MSELSSPPITLAVLAQTYYLVEISTRGGLNAFLQNTKTRLRRLRAPYPPLEFSLYLSLYLSLFLFLSHVNNDLSELSIHSKINRLRSYQFSGGQ